MGVYIEEAPTGPRPITGVPTSIAAFVGPTADGPVNEARQMFSFADFERTFGGLHSDSELSYAVSHFFLNGGRTCWIVRSAGNEPMIGSRADKTGIYALEDADIFNVLCLPGVHEVTALGEAIGYAEERRAMMIVDIDAKVATFDAARDWIVDGANGALRSSNAAAYFPRIHLADPLQNGQPRAFPNSGLIAGLWARTDTERGIWKAPAGLDAQLHGVQALDCELSQLENDVLNPLGLNCLRTFPASGTVSWGARTLLAADEPASEWRYIPVHRMALFVEESLDRGTRFAAFERDGEPLRAQLRLAAEAFMNELFRQGAFQGVTPRDAYFVRCDAATTPAMDVDLELVDIKVGFAPLRPAEFVVVSIQQMAGQSRA